MTSSMRRPASQSCIAGMTLCRIETVPSVSVCARLDDHTSAKTRRVACQVDETDETKALTRPSGLDDEGGVGVLPSRRFVNGGLRGAAPFVNISIANVRRFAGPRQSAEWAGK